MLKLEIQNGSTLFWGEGVHCQIIPQILEPHQYLAQDLYPGENMV